MSFSIPALIEELEAQTAARGLWKCPSSLALASSSFCRASCSAPCLAFAAGDA
jgi:hypothetical protein